MPADDADLVRKALFAAGAGVIGEYDHCSWAVEGQGTFFGRAKARTSRLGRGVANEAAERTRSRSSSASAQAARHRRTDVAAHLDEELANDVYRWSTRSHVGLGASGALPAAQPLVVSPPRSTAVLLLPSLRFAGDAARSAARAVPPGSGAEAIAAASPRSPTRS